MAEALPSVDDDFVRSCRKDYNECTGDRTKDTEEARLRWAISSLMWQGSIQHAMPHAMRPMGRTFQPGLAWMLRSMRRVPLCAVLALVL
jgi:hypothetical protein